MRRHRKSSLYAVLWHAQGGLCFYCKIAMQPRRRLNPNGEFDKRATKDHVFPRGSSGRGLLNNIVLAHNECNNAKGSRQPTPDEIERAREMYASFGQVAFISFEDYLCRGSQL